MIMTMLMNVNKKIHIVKPIMIIITMIIKSISSCVFATNG